MFQQKAIDVLVYCGEGVSNLFLKQTLSTFRLLLANNYSVITVEAQQLATEPWEKSTRLLIIPGGRDAPYNRDLSGRAAEKIREFVNNGGSYLGLCAGGYFGSAKCIFEPNSPLCVIGDRPLKFFPNACKGTAFPGFKYNSEEGARCIGVIIQKESFKQRKASKWYCELKSPNPSVYYNGGGYFVDADSYSNIMLDYSWDFESSHVDASPNYHVNVLARYQDSVFDPENRTNLIEDAAAIVACHYGKGIAILSGVHPEISYNAFEGISTNDKHLKDIVEKLKSTEKDRITLMVAMLQYIGLDVNINSINECLQASEKVITPTFILPIKGCSVSDISQFSYKLNKFTTPGTSVIDDNLNAIKFSVVNSDFTRLAHRSITKGTKEHISKSNVDASSEKNVIDLYFCSSRFPSDFQAASQFNIEDFTHYMKQTNTKKLGNWLMYTDVTTSTQTFLEKNYILQKTLPSPIVNLASTQVSGRGRGNNAWISPPGCLMSSIYMHHPLSKIASPVFIQYLVVLSIIEGLATKPQYKNLPLAIKWPNDLYAISSGENPDDPPLLKKLGGTIVNSFSENGYLILIIGTGINVGNPLPTASINQVIDDYNSLNRTRIPNISLEEILAIYLAKFEELYYKFLRSGFAQFEELYYKHWLHSDQTVTLKNYDYDKVKITGISSENGFLTAESLGSSKKKYELHPNGNSFDMTSGLIGKKS